MNRWLMVLPPGDPRHGRPIGYLRYGCREDCCRKPASAMKAAWRARQVPPPPGDLRHGKASTYRDYHCRCEPCRMAAGRANGIARKTPPTG